MEELRSDFESCLLPLMTEQRPTDVKSNITSTGRLPTAFSKSVVQNRVNRTGLKTQAYSIPYKSVPFYHSLMELTDVCGKLSRTSEHISRAPGAELARYIKDCLMPMKLKQIVTSSLILLCIRNHIQHCLLSSCTETLRACHLAHVRSVC